MEFYADNFALLLSIFWVLEVILAYYDRMKTNHEISKSLFYFEGTKGIKFEKNKEIKFNDLKTIKELIESKEKLEKERLVGKTQEKENLQDDNKIIAFELNTAENENTNTNDKINQKVNNYIRRNTKAELDYSSYNIFEMIGNLKIFFCKSKNLEKR